MNRVRLVFQTIEVGLGHMVGIGLRLTEALVLISIAWSMFFDRAGLPVALAMAVLVMLWRLAFALSELLQSGGGHLLEWLVLRWSLPPTWIPTVPGVICAASAGAVTYGLLESRFELFVTIPAVVLSGVIACLLADLLALEKALRRR